MTDDIIRNATTADYIETIDNLRAEVERLRVALAHELDLRNLHIESLEARIKELEADRIAYRNLGSRIEDLETYIERLEAAFLESEAAMLFYRGARYPVWPDIGAHAEVYRQKAREALERIRNGE